MRRGWLLLALGVGAYLVFVLVTLPASIVAARLETRGLTTVGSGGTIWAGRLIGLRSGSTAIGDVAWDLEPLRLFTGRIAGHVTLTRPDGQAAGNVALGWNGNVVIDRAKLALPFDALAGSGAPAGWQGRLEANVVELVIEDGWIARLTGTIEARDIVGPARRPAEFGGFRVVLPADPTSAAAPSETLVGSLADLGDGPLIVTGTIRLERDRSYEIDGMVAPRPAAPRGVVDSLKFLGTPDADGRRPFSIAGSL